MKLILAIIAALTLGSALLHAQPAECVYCGNLFCTSTANCFEGCTCIRLNGGSDALDAEDGQQPTTGRRVFTTPTDRQLRDRLEKSSHGKDRRHGPVKHWSSQDAGT